MAKITINPLSGSYGSVVAINNRLQQIEDALNNNVLWRYGVGSEANEMNNDIDMNGYSLLNALIDASNLLDAYTFVGELPAYYLARANHTGTQLLATISDVTATADEVNVLDGIPPTLTATELGYVDGVTSGIQGQIDDKAPIADPTFTGEIGIGAVNVSETELGILEGATVSTSELNILDGVTATAEDINNSIHFPTGETNASALPNVATRANKYLGFDGSGDIVVSVGTATVDANAVLITDAGGYYTDPGSGKQVEAALQENGAILATVGGNTSGDILTTDDTQTLTSKTLTSPTVNTPTISSATFSGTQTGFTGDVTGDCSGSSGSCTGNANTATTATTAGTCTGNSATASTATKVTALDSDSISGGTSAALEGMTGSYMCHTMTVANLSRAVSPSALYAICRSGAGDVGTQFALFTLGTNTTDVSFFELRFYGNCTTGIEKKFHLHGYDSNGAAVLDTVVASGYSGAIDGLRFYTTGNGPFTGEFRLQPVA